MTILLAALLVLQEQTAEEVFKVIEENVAKTPAFSLKFTYEIKNGQHQPLHGSGMLRVKTGNKVSYSSSTGYSWICNDRRIQESRSRVYDEGILAQEFRRLGRPASNDTERTIRSLVVRMGSGINAWTRVPFDPELADSYDPKLRMKDLKYGEGDDKSRTLLYQLASYDRSRPYEVRLKYDTKSYLILERKMTRKQQDGTEWTITEVYTEFILNADLPDDLFNLP